MALKAGATVEVPLFTRSLTAFSAPPGTAAAVGEVRIECRLTIRF